LREQNASTHAIGNLLSEEGIGLAESTGTVADTSLQYVFDNMDNVKNPSKKVSVLFKKKINVVFFFERVIAYVVVADNFTYACWPTRGRITKFAAGSVYVHGAAQR
jgi:hypothetical protein